MNSKSEVVTFFCSLLHLSKARRTSEWRLYMIFTLSKNSHRDGDGLTAASRDDRLRCRPAAAEPVDDARSQRSTIRSIYIK